MILCCGIQQILLNFCRSQFDYATTMSVISFEYKDADRLGTLRQKVCYRACFSPPIQLHSHTETTSTSIRCVYFSFSSKSNMLPCSKLSLSQPHCTVHLKAELLQECHAGCWFAPVGRIAGGKCVGRSRMLWGRRSGGRGGYGVGGVGNVGEETEVVVKEGWKMGCMRGWGAGGVGGGVGVGGGGEGLRRG